MGEERETERENDRETKQITKISIFVKLPKANLSPNKIKFKIFVFKMLPERRTIRTSTGFFHFNKMSSSLCELERISSSTSHPGGGRGGAGGRPCACSSSFIFMFRCFRAGKE